MSGKVRNSLGDPLPETAVGAQFSEELQSTHFVGLRKKYYDLKYVEL